MKIRFINVFILRLHLQSDFRCSWFQIIKNLVSKRAVITFKENLLIFAFAFHNFRFRNQFSSIPYNWYISDVTVFRTATCKNTKTYLKTLVLPRVKFRQ